MIIQRCQDKRYQFLPLLGMQSSALRRNLVPDKGIAECNASIPTDHARRERVLQIIKVENERASFADLLVDVTPDRNFLNIVHDESMRLGVITVVIVSLLGHIRHDFGPVVRHYEVSDSHSRKFAKLL